MLSLHSPGQSKEVQKDVRATRRHSPEQQLGIELEPDVDEVSLAGRPLRLADRNFRRHRQPRDDTRPERIQRVDASPVSHRMFDRPQYPQMRAVESLRI